MEEKVVINTESSSDLNLSGKVIEENPSDVNMVQQAEAKSNIIDYDPAQHGWGNNL